MRSTPILACFALLALACPSFAQTPATVLHGKEAADEIAIFMKTRWHRQAWRIVSKPVDDPTDSRSMWLVEGTNHWVRLDSPDGLKEHCDLAKLDPKSIYEIVGLPVDQNYGTITFYILSSPKKITAETLTQPGKATTSPPHSPNEMLSENDATCLVEACRLVALINDGKWEEAEKAFSGSPGMVAILKQHSSLDYWKGIGAYRGSRIDQESPRRITFRFGFAPESSPHEIWLTFTDDNSSKPGLMILGW